MQCQKNFKYFTIWELQGTIVSVYTIDKIEECANASSLKKKKKSNQNYCESHSRKWKKIFQELLDVC